MTQRVENAAVLGHAAMHVAAMARRVRLNPAPSLSAQMCLECQLLRGVRMLRAEMANAKPANLIRFMPAEEELSYPVFVDVRAGLWRLSVRHRPGRPSEQKPPRRLAP